MNIQYSTQIYSINHYPSETMEFLSDFDTAFRICFNHNEHKPKDVRFVYKVIDLRNGFEINIFAGYPGRETKINKSIIK